MDNNFESLLVNPIKKGNAIVLNSSDYPVLMSLNELNERKSKLLSTNYTKYENNNIENLDSTHSVPGEFIKQENVVMTAQLSNPIDSRVIIRFKTSDFRNISVNIFPSSKIVTTGAKSVESAVSSIIYSVRIIEHIRGTQIDIKNLKLQTTIISVTLPGKYIDLIKLNTGRSDICIYSPDTFPTVTIKVPSGYDYTCNVFSKGRFVLCGSHTQEYSRQLIDHIYSTVLPYIYG